MMSIIQVLLTVALVFVLSLHAVYQSYLLSKPSMMAEYIEVEARGVREGWQTKEEALVSIAKALEDAYGIEVVVTDMEV